MPVLLEEVVSSRPLLLICFLEVPELSPILDFLENLAGTCILFSIPEIADHGFGERIVFNADFSCLLFDERYLRGEGKSKRKKKKQFYKNAPNSKVFNFNFIFIFYYWFPFIACSHSYLCLLQATGGAKEQHPPHQQNVEQL